MPTKLIVFAVALLLFQCQPKPQENTETVAKEVNPAAEGFDTAGSDATAIALADEVMESMGGRVAGTLPRLFLGNFSRRAGCFGISKTRWRESKICAMT